MSGGKILIVVLFVAAAILRLADAFRPIDKPSWRECDLGSISRNFVREGMNPFYPRIDWRGSGPGYAEMELPLYPFLTALSYQTFGANDHIGRVWAFLFSIGALFFFYKLAREYLTPFAAGIAFIFFAIHPLVLEIATSIQPEGLMLFAYIGAAFFFVRWLKEEKPRDYWLAVCATSVAVLAKAPSGHIGLLFGILLIQKYGWSVIKQPRVWLFGIVTLLPPAIWYFHAKNLWLTYGNSLGVSNEHHWVGWDFFTDSTFLTGILRMEYLYVWGPFALVVAAFAIWRGYSERMGRHSLYWLASIFLLYVLASRTTSEDWANYYHVFTVVPAALIFGFGVTKLGDYMRESADSFSRSSAFERLASLFVMLLVASALLATLLVEAKQARASLRERRIEDPAFAFAKQAKPLLTREGLILASGGFCRDPKGYPVAYNSSYMFYWLDRKGWNVCVEDQSIASLRDYQAKGAQYFVAEKKYTREHPGFEAELARTFPTIFSAEGFAVFDIAVAK